MDAALLCHMPRSGSAPQTLDGQRELPEKSAMRYGQLVGAIAVRMVVLQFGPRHTGGRRRGEVCVVLLWAVGRLDAWTRSLKTIIE